MSIVTPFVSVIIPVYKAEQFIEKCAVSLFQQTLENVEYIFINDNTPDSSIEILKKVIELYPQRKTQCVIIDMPCNLGQAIVRRTGIKIATGEYIIHCDSDDYVDPSMLEKMYRTAIENDSDYVVCDYFYNQIKKTGCIHTNRELFIKDLLSSKVTTALWNKLIHRKLYLNSSIWYPSGNMGEDLVLAVQTAYASRRISYIEEGFYFYEYNPDSIVSTIIKNGDLSVYFQLCRNVEALKFWFYQKDNGSLYNDAILALKVEKYNTISPLIDNPFYYKIWVKLFDGMIWPCLFSKSIDIKSKIKVILIRFKIFKFAKSITPKIDINFNKINFK